MATTPQTIQTINPNYRVSLSGTNELGETIDIVAALPEKFNIHVSSEWESLFDGGHVGSAIGTFSSDGEHLTNRVSDLARRFTGFSGQTKELSQLIWRATSPIQFSVEFQFNAVSNPQVEIIQPLKTLLKLVLPSTFNPAGGLESFHANTPTETFGVLQSLSNSATTAINGAINYAGKKIDSLQFLRGPGPSPSIAAKIFGSGTSNPYNLTLGIGKYLKFPSVIALDARAELESLFTTNGDYLSCTVEMTFSTSSMFTKSDIDNSIPDSTSSYSGSPNSNIGVAGQYPTSNASVVGSNGIQGGGV